MELVHWGIATHGRLYHKLCDTFDQQNPASALISVLISVCRAFTIAAEPHSYTLIIIHPSSAENNCPFLVLPLQHSKGASLSVRSAINTCCLLHSPCYGKAVSEEYNDLPAIFIVHASACQRFSVTKQFCHQLHQGFGEYAIHGKVDKVQ